MSQGPHYIGHRKRLKERLLRDARSMADYEVLEMLLAYALPRRDTKPLAKALLTRFGTLRGVLEARTGDLMAVDGFGPGLTAFWTLWAELRARVEETPVAERTILGSPAEVAAWGIARLGGKPREEVWAALVDNRNRLLAWERIALGTADSASAPVREVLALALEHKAGGMVLVHNHPGGDPRPSQGDLEWTRRVLRAAKDLGVRLLDHLIVTEDKYFSLREEGLLQGGTNGAPGNKSKEVAMIRSMQCKVSGKVQGVCFRAWTRDEAASLGLKGWVRNLRDGTVEVLVQGDEQAAAELGKRLLAGPTLARVDDIECKWIDYDTEHDDFHIRN